MTSGSLRIIIVTWHWPPSSEIGGKVIYRLAHRLARLGCDIRVLTAPESRIKSHDPRFGTRAPAGIRVVDVSPYPDPIAMAARFRNKLRGGPRSATVNGGVVAVSSSSEPRRPSMVETLYELPDVVRPWIGPASRRLRRMVAEEPADLIISVSPYFSAHMVVEKSGLHRRGVPWFAWSHDPKTGNPYKAHLPAWRERMVARWEERIIRQATFNLVTTQALADEYRRLFPGIAAPYVLPCGFEREELVAASAGDAAGNPADRLTIAHVGTLYGHRTPLPIFEALARLRGQGKLTNELRLRCIGDASSMNGESLEAAIARLSLGDLVELSGPVPHHHAMAVLAAADVGLVLAEGQPLQIPAKTFEYVGMRRPIFALADGATADLVHDNGVGFVASGDTLDKTLLEMVAAWRLDRLASFQPPLERAAARYDVETLAKEVLALLTDRHARKTIAD